jgi:hypothetical protein
MIARGLICVGPLCLVLGACAPGLTASVDENARGSGDQRQLGVLGGADAASGSRAAVGQGGAFPTAEATGSGAERAFATAVLGDLQRESFAANAEHCGYLGIDSSGAYVTSPVSIGTEASCTLPSVPGGMTVLASFHTHGTYSPSYASEFPTSTDMLTDAADGIDGYISTPGGRLWYVDTDTMTVRQLCGRGCLPQDPAYRPEDDGPVRPSFTLRDLQAYEGL